MPRTTSDGYIVDDNGIVIGYADQPAQPQTVRVGNVDPFKVQDQRFQANADARASEKAAQDARMSALEMQLKQQQLAEAEAKAAPEKAYRAQLQKLLGQQDLANSIQEASANTNDWTAGLGSYLNLIPGTDATDLSADLDTIGGNLAFDRLQQMRDASPTGGALGSITEKELALLQSTVASLNQRQSPEKLRANLEKVAQHYQNLQSIMNNPQFANGAGNVVLDANGVQLSNQIDPAATARQGVAMQLGRTEKDLVIPPEVQRQAYGYVAQRGNRNINAKEYADFVNGLFQQYNVPGVMTPENAQYTVDALKRGASYGGLTPPKQKMTPTEQSLNDIGASDFGAYALKSADALAAPTVLAGYGDLASFTEDPNTARGGMAATQAEHPKSSFLGDVSGVTLGTILTGGAGRAAGLSGAAATPLATDTAYAAMYGAGQSPDNRLGGAITGGALGLLGHKVGGVVANKIGGTIKGVTDPMVRYLDRRGVPMTLGQMLGGTAKAAEDRRTSIPGIGDKIQEMRRAGFEGMNRAAFTEGGAPIGFAPKAIAETGNEQFQKAAGDSYSFLDPLNFNVDQAMAADLSGVKAAGAAIKGPLASSVDDTMQMRLKPFIDPAQLSFDGRGAKSMLRGVKMDKAAQYRKGEVGSDLYAEQANNILGAIEGAIGRQAPDVVPKLNASNKAYMSSQILNDAVAAAMNTGGIFSSAQLGQAARKGVKAYGGKSKTGTTARPFFALQRAAQEVLPSSIPDSGTAGRSMEGNLASRALAAGQSALLSPIYSQAAQPLIRSLLLERPAAARAIGKGIQKKKGLFGRSATIPLLAWTSD